jgi:hypothetical protein
MTTTITFAANELDELKNFYQAELEKTIKRVEDIKSILQKLSGTTDTKSPSKPRGFAAMPKDIVNKIASMGGHSSHGGGRPAKKNKRTKSIPWRKFIPQLIKKEGSVTTHDIINAAMTKYNYPDKDKLLRTLGPTLTRMTKTGKLTFDRKHGQKAHFYSLPSVPTTVKGTNGTAVTA